MPKIITEDYKISNAESFIDALRNTNEPIVSGIFSDSVAALTSEGITLNQSQSDALEGSIETSVDEYFPLSPYYLFGSTQKPYIGTIDDSQKFKSEFLRQTIFGILMDESDVRFTFMRNPWVAGTIYSQHDDSFKIPNNESYVTVFEGAENEGTYYVYRCISDNRGSPSTVSPSSAINGVGIAELSDGYTWAYMFAVPASEYTIFGSGEQIPYVKNPSPIILDGIYRIVVENSPKNLYNSNSNLKNCRIISSVSEGNNYRLSIVTDSTPSNENNYYNNFYLKVNSIGGVFEILESSTDDDSPTNREVTILVSSKSVGSDFAQARTDFLDDCIIAPKIEVSESDFGENAIAYGVIGPDNELFDIVMSSNGSGYEFATANLKITSDQNAETEERVVLRPVISPLGGHNSNPVTELSMSSIIYQKEITSLGTNIPEFTEYTQLGIVKTPEFESGLYPTTFDNRMAIEVNGPVGPEILVGMTLQQGRKYAIVNEVAFDGTDTTIFVTNYDNVGTAVFMNTEAEIIDDNGNRIATITINNTTRQSDYKSYSGRVTNFVHFDKITRDISKREVVKFIFDF